MQVLLGAFKLRLSKLFSFIGPHYQIRHQLFTTGHEDDWQRRLVLLFCNYRNQVLALPKHFYKPAS